MLFYQRRRHRPGSSSKFSEPPFNKVGGTDLLPQGGVFDLEEGQELFFAFFERGQRPGVEVLPCIGKTSHGGSGLPYPRGIADGSQVFLGGFLVPFPDAVQDVSGLMRPTALNGIPG